MGDLSGTKAPAHDGKWKRTGVAQHFRDCYTDKKENKNFLMYKEIQKKQLPLYI